MNCPQCKNGKLQSIGSHFFCLDCDYDDLPSRKTIFDMGRGVQTLEIIIPCISMHDINVHLARSENARSAMQSLLLRESAQCRTLRDLFWMEHVLRQANNLRTFFQEAVVQLHYEMGGTPPTWNISPPPFEEN